MKFKVKESKFIMQEQDSIYYSVVYYDEVGQHGEHSSHANFKQALVAAINFKNRVFKEDDPPLYIGVEGNGLDFAIIHITKSYRDYMSPQYFKDGADDYDTFIKYANRALSSGKVVIGRYPDSVSKKVKESIIVEKKMKYDLKNVNGGYSDGVNIDAVKNPGTVGIGVNIYGGGTSNVLRYQTPQKIKEYQDAYLASVRVGDQLAIDISSSLNDYKKKLKKVIGGVVIKLLEEFDMKVKTAIDSAVASVNNTYVVQPNSQPRQQTQPTQQQQLVAKPKNAAPTKAGVPFSPQNQ